MPKLTNQKKLNEWSELYLGNFNAHLGDFLMREICRQDRHGRWHRYSELSTKEKPWPKNGKPTLYSNTKIFNVCNTKSSLIFFLLSTYLINWSKILMWDWNIKNVESYTTIMRICELFTHRPTHTPLHTNTHSWPGNSSCVVGIIGFVLVHAVLLYWCMLSSI